MHQQAPSPVEQVEQPVSESTAPTSSGDDVMKILADVEGQLNRLREAQKTQDHAIVSLADRARLLRAAEDEMSTIRAELESQRRTLTHDREQLDAQRGALEQQSQQARAKYQQQEAELAKLRTAIENDRAAITDQTGALTRRQSELEQSQKHWDQQRQLHESELAKRHAELEQRGAELAKRQLEFDAERTRVEALSAQCKQQQTQLDARSRQMQAEHAELLHRVEQAEKNVGELIQQLEKSQQDVSARTAQVKQAGQEAAQFRTRAETLENALHEATKRGDQLERDSAELARLADRERDAVEKKLTASTSALTEAGKARDAAQKELAAVREQAASLEKRAKGLELELVDRTAQLRDVQKKLDLAGQKLSEFARVLSDQTPQLERGAAAVAMVEEQQQQIDRLAKQLAELKLKSDPEEVDRRDDRIAQLTEALRQARGQSAGQQGIAELEHRNAELTAEVDQLRLALENAQLVAEETKRQLEERVDDESAPTTHDASVAEHQARIAALTAEVERLQAMASDKLKSELEAQSKRHKKEISEAHQSDAGTIKSLQKRINELEADLKDAQSKDQSPLDENQYAQKLRDKAERITAVAEHLRRRRTRLAKLRSILVHRVASAEESPHTRMRTEEVLNLEQDRLQLAEVRQALAVSEKRMVRKWAVQRAGFTVACLFFYVALCAAGAWLTADHFAPAQISASVSLEAKGRQRSPMSAEQGEQWAAWHTQLLSDPVFEQTVAKRLAERRIDQYANPDKLSQRLTRDLTIDTAQDGTLLLTMAGTDKDEVTTLLDVIGATLAMESNRQMSSRTDTQPAVFTSERQVDGRVRYANVNPVAIRDDRLSYAAPIFGVLVVLGLTMFLIVFIKLSKAKRVFEDENAAVVLE